ncbi:hypothetical protein D3C72_1210290 [compost metagenome]
MAGDRNEIREHAVANCRGNLRIRQRIEPDIHDPFLADHLLPVKDGTLIVHIVVIRCQERRRLARGQFLQQGQQGGNDLIKIGSVITNSAAQAVQHRIPQFFSFIRAQRHLNGPHPHRIRLPLHVARQVFFFKHAGRQQILHLLQQVRRLQGQHIFYVGLIELTNIGHVAQDKGVVRTLTQCHQCPGDDVHKTPGEFSKRRRVPLTGQLPCNA